MQSIWSITLTVEAEEFIAAQEWDAQAAIKALLTRARAVGPQGGVLGKRSKPLGDGLFEFKVGDIRLFFGYSTRQRNEVVVLGGIVKKRGNIPPDVLGLMRRKKKDI